MGKSIIYVTSNKSKVFYAKRHLEPEGINVVAKYLDMTEMQSHSGEAIIRHKAEQAFSTFKKPLIVSDHFWNIPALKGFPGAYMKHVNEWLTPQDFLNLMKPYTNRTIYLEEHMCFIDKDQQKLFYTSIKGKVLHEVKGEAKQGFRSIITLKKDGKSIAECWNENINAVDRNQIWKDLADYIKGKQL